MLKIGYDAQAFLAPNRGTGKGLQLRNLLGSSIGRFTGFASAGANPSGLPLIQTGPSGYQIWHQLWLPWSLLRHRIDLFLAPYNTAPLLLPPRVGLILVLHDTILAKGFRRSGLKGRLMDLYRSWLIPPSVRRARIVLTVSQHARQEILARFPRAEVRVISCTIAERWFAPRPLSGRAGHVLMVTSSAPHKNAAGAIEAYIRYAERAGGGARRLKIVGLASEEATYRKQIAQSPAAEMVQFLPFVSDTELLALYQDAAALFFPSFAEGFGIPMLEAMATGTPVIAAGATSLPEVGGAAAYYFNPSSTDEMAEALTFVLSNDGLREQMAARGLIRAEAFRPEIIANQVNAFWEEMAGERIRAAAAPPLEARPALDAGGV